MASTDSLVSRRLKENDLDDLETLVAEANWNQTREDWLRMLSLGSGHDRRDEDGHVIASALTTAYDNKIGWIGMVLVANAWRRRGLATDLLTDCISQLRSRDVVPGLDATPAGETVYRKLGFRGEMTITRWRRDAAKPDVVPLRLEKLTADDLDWITAIDESAFGASRRELMGALLNGKQSTGWKIEKSAFLMRRPGRTACYFGPLAATDATAAERLLRTAVNAEPGPILIDVPDRHARIAELLQSAGFARERSFLRMYLDGPVTVGDPSLTFALAGPEIG